MKTINFLFLSLLLTTRVYGQDKKYVKAMENNITALDSAKTTEQLQYVANSFERISNAEKKEWLPYYYLAYNYTMIGIKESDLGSKDLLYEKAQMYADKADSLSLENSEIYTLKAFILQMKVGVDPKTRGGKLAPAIWKFLEKAMALTPENPRPFYLKGQSLFYTPPQYGGGKAKALPFLEQAVEKYSKFKPTSNIMPNWGEQKAKATLEQCKTIE